MTDYKPGMMDTLPEGKSVAPPPKERKLFNIVRVDNLLLGCSVTTEMEALLWAVKYGKRYKNMTFVVVQTDMVQTCDIPRRE